MNKLNQKPPPKNNKIIKAEKVLTYENVSRLLKGRQKVLNGFESKILPIGNQKHGKGLKILSPKQMFQRLTIALAQLIAGNTFENLLNKILKIVYSLYQVKEITKNLHNNIVNSKNS